MYFNKTTRYFSRRLSFVDFQEVTAPVLVTNFATTINHIKVAPVNVTVLITCMGQPVTVGKSYMVESNCFN